ncbi:MAG: iron-containing alcohol dehydrogenase, partial [Planctomycetota bacterium]
MNRTDREPSSPSRVVLVGMMGVGKTRVGEALAERLGATFRDSDQVIEARQEQAIASIFEKRGEAAFRDLERDVIEQLLKEPGDWVLALGGGAVLDEATRKELVASGLLVVWLQAPADELARQTGGDSRPLLAGLDEAQRAERLGALLEERAPFYAAVSNAVVLGGTREAAESAEEIGELLLGEGVVTVDLGEARSYEVRVGAGILARLGAILRELGAPAGRIGVVTDPNVLDLWTEEALRSLAEQGMQPVLAVLPPGESGKRLTEVERVADLFTEGGLDRGSWIVGIGGGAVTDVAGFVAATFRRGIPWVACPTTLLGMVDASVGGKTGVNLGSSKNQVGAFHQPRAVLADVRTLRSLPAREVRSGFGEVVKAA